MDVAKFAMNGKIKRPESYDSDSFDAEYSRPDSSPFLDSSFSSISQIGDGSISRIRKGRHSNEASRLVILTIS